MIANNPLHNVQTKSCAFTHRLRGEKWIENAPLYFRWNARSVIGELDKNGFRLPRCANFKYFFSDWKSVV